MRDLLLGARRRATWTSSSRRCGLLRAAPGKRARRPREDPRAGSGRRLSSLPGGERLDVARRAAEDVRPARARCRGFARRLDRGGPRAPGLHGQRDGARDRAGTAELVDPYGGRADLRRGVIRVLHPRSFVDDPTRAFPGGPLREPPRVSHRAGNARRASARRRGAGRSTRSRGIGSVARSRSSFPSRAGPRRPGSSRASGWPGRSTRLFGTTPPRARRLRAAERIAGDSGRAADWVCTFSPGWALPPSGRRGRSRRA